MTIVISNSHNVTLEDIDVEIVVIRSSTATDESGFTRIICNASDCSGRLTEDGRIDCAICKIIEGDSLNETPQLLQQTPDSGIERE